MKANVLNNEGKASTLYMGCYGIGVSRLVAATIEQNNDEKRNYMATKCCPF
jgi:prolyl-tRNA synthetase